MYTFLKYLVNFFHIIFLSMPRKYTAWNNSSNFGNIAQSNLQGFSFKCGGGHIWRVEDNISSLCLQQHFPTWPVKQWLQTAVMVGKCHQSTSHAWQKPPHSTISKTDRQHCTLDSSCLIFLSLLVTLLLMWQNTMMKKTYQRKILFVLQFQRDETQYRERCLKATDIVGRAEAEGWHLWGWDSRELGMSGAFWTLNASP